MPMGFTKEEVIHAVDGGMTNRAKRITADLSYALGMIKYCGLHESEMTNVLREMQKLIDKAREASELPFYDKNNGF